MSSRYESLVALKERATIHGEMNIAEGIQKLIDTYYNRVEPHVEPHKEETRPQGWMSRLWLWLKEA